MLIFSLILFLIGGGIYFFLTWNYKHWTRRGIPFPQPHILSGNLSSVVTKRQHIVYDVDKIYNEFKDKYSFVGIYNMRQPQYLITDASLVSDILIKKFCNFHDNEIADITNKRKDPLLGSNPFMLKGEEWKEKRAEIAPAFTQFRIKAMYPIIENVAQHLKKSILKQNYCPMDGRELSLNYTTDVIASCIFGIDAGALSTGNAAFREMCERIVPASLKLKIYFLIIQLLPSIKKIYKISIVEKAVERFFVKLMEDSIDVRRKSKINRIDHLNYLMELQLKKNISVLDMVAHTLAFLLDGMKTSGSVLSFALYQLGRNRDVQEKLRKEIREIRTKHKHLTFEILQDMPYLEQIVSETLRLHSPCVFLRKICTKSCKLPLTESKMMTIDEGYSVIIPVYSIHRDSRYFRDPEKFMPERFALERGGTKIHRERGTFIPQSDGPRICMGIRFAQAQLKAALVAIVEDFEITIDPRTSDKPLLNPKEIYPTLLGGIWLRFRNLTG